MFLFGLFGCLFVGDSSWKKKGASVVEASGLSGGWLIGGLFAGNALQGWFWC
jgi:hypothetical protein